MPADLILHIAHALSLDRLHHDGGGNAFGRLCLGESRLKLIEIISIRLCHMEAESFELIHNGIRVNHVADTPVDLQIIVIDNDAKVVQLVVMRKQHRLPDLTLLDLTSPSSA